MRADRMTEKASPSPFRYSAFTKATKQAYRKVFPTPKSSATMRKIENICEVNFVPPEVLHAFFKRAIKMLQQARGQGQDLAGVSIGDYLEFGVFNGTSLASMYLACQELGVSASTTRFFGFDAFEGLPPDAEKGDGGVWKGGFYKCSFEQMEGCIQKRGVDPKDINWVKGWYNDTLNAALVEKYNLADLGIIFVDCDTYGSSKTVLDFVAPLIKKSAIVCLDDWKINDLDIKGMGEYQAFNEFLEANTHLTAKEIRSYNRESKSFLVKPR